MIIWRTMPSGNLAKVLAWLAARHKPSVSHRNERPPTAPTRPANDND